MSDAIKHECGVAMLRLLKPLSFYHEKYGTSLYGLNKMYLLMEKQHNRGQDGVGLANVKLDVPAGKRYISRKRSISTNPIQDVFKQINKKFVALEKKAPENLNNSNWLRVDSLVTSQYAGDSRDARVAALYVWNFIASAPASAASCISRFATSILPSWLTPASAIT